MAPEPVRIALEQAATIRKERKKAIDIYPVNANVVNLGSGKWAAELYMGAAGTDLVEGFNNPFEASAWIKQKAQAYMEQKGVPKGTKIKKSERYKKHEALCSADE
jgi:hypothetical protein